MVTTYLSTIDRRVRPSQRVRAAAGGSGPLGGRSRRRGHGRNGLRASASAIASTDTRRQAVAFLTLQPMAEGGLGVMTGRGASAVEAKGRESRSQRTRQPEAGAHDSSRDAAERN